MTSTEVQAPRQGTTAPTPGRAGEGEAADYEETHVHGVYEAIASHFSATRHKPWPFVSSFLARQPPGSVGLDVGCGNGKNMGVNRDVLMFGCDRSAALIALARNMWCTGSSSTQQKDDHHVQQGGPPPPPAAVLPRADATVADSLALPFRDGCADFVICIAVIHHMSTRERRIEAIRQLLRCIRRGKTQPSGHDNDSNNKSGGGGGGQVLVYVWALEQNTSRRGWDQGGEQDLLVPWVMKAPQTPQEKQPKKDKKNKANKNSKQARKQEKQQAGAAVETQAKGDDRNDDEDATTTLTTTNGANGGSRILTSGGESSGSRDMQKQGQQEQSRGNHAETAARDGDDDGGYEADVATAATTGGKSTTTTNITRGGGEGGGAEDVQVAPVTAAGAVVDATADAAGACTVTGNVPRDEVEKESLCGGGGLPAETETAEKKEKKQQQQGVGRGIDEQQRQRQQEQHRQRLTDKSQAETEEKDKTFHRFYHLYRKGELEEDVLAAGGQVLESGYERDNWWVIAG